MFFEFEACPSKGFVDAAEDCPTEVFCVAKHQFIRLAQDATTAPAQAEVMRHDEIDEAARVEKQGCLNVLGDPVWIFAKGKGVRLESGLKRGVEDGAGGPSHVVN